tara:strand:- start:6755 stop:7258 length:504 start_codon:yes stop_codon:yes gene_type:complete
MTRKEFLSLFLTNYLQSEDLVDMMLTLIYSLEKEESRNYHIDLWETHSSLYYRSLEENLSKHRAYHPLKGLFSMYHNDYVNAYIQCYHPDFIPDSLSYRTKNIYPGKGSPDIFSPRDIVSQPKQDEYLKYFGYSYLNRYYILDEIVTRRLKKYITDAIYNLGNHTSE